MVRDSVSGRHPGAGPDPGQSSLEIGGHAMTPNLAHGRGSYRLPAHRMQFRVDPGPGWRRNRDVVGDTGAMETTLDTAGDVFDMVVEIPKGSRNKYEVDHESGAIRLDRHLFTATAYPADYGFLPETLGEDGDPLDVLVLLEEPTFPGCWITARAIGVFWMRDEMGPDAKILAVPAGDPRWDHIGVLGDVSPHLRAEIGHFFEIYKALEPSKSTEVGEWGGRSEATEEISRARQRFSEADH